MRIGLVADTHVPVPTKVLWPEVRKALEGVDLILHAGDIYDRSCLEWLEQIAPVKAVLGNGDHATVHPDLNQTEILEIEGHRIGLVHYLYYPGPPLEQTLRQTFAGEQVDVVIFGDTHVEYIEQHNGVLLVNPGSPTFPHNLQPQLGTVGLLEVTSAGVEARIISLKEL